MHPINVALHLFFLLKILPKLSLFHSHSYSLNRFIVSARLPGAAFQNLSTISRNSRWWNEASINLKSMYFYVLFRCNYSSNIGWWSEEALTKCLIDASSFLLQHCKLPHALSIISRVRALQLRLLNQVNFGPWNPRSIIWHKLIVFLNFPARDWFIGFSPYLSIWVKGWLTSPIGTHEKLIILPNCWIYCHSSSVNVTLWCVYHRE